MVELNKLTHPPCPLSRHFLSFVYQYVSQVEGEGDDFTLSSVCKCKMLKSS